MISQTATKPAPYIIKAGTSLMTRDHKRWVKFEQDTEATYAVKYTRGMAQMVLVVTKGTQRGAYAPRGM